jgi:hypothetical protein
VWGAFVWGVFLAVRGFSTWGGCPSSFVVNQAVGCVLFGLCRRDELVMGGSVKKGQHVGGVLPFIVVGGSHFWGWAALLSCIGA